MAQPTAEELTLKIEGLEERIAAYDLSDKKILSLSSLCSLLGTDHRKNINIIVDQTCEILSGTYALYRRYNSQGKKINTWSGEQPLIEFDELLFMDVLDNKILQKNNNKPCTIIVNLATPSHLSCLCAAVIMKKEIIGSLSLFDNEPKQYSETDKRVISTLAKAVAIEEERSIAEKAIQVREERYRTILEDIKEGYYEVDLKGNFLFVSSTFCEIFGYSEVEVLGRNYVEFSTPETAERAYSIFHTVFSTDCPAKGLAWEVPRRDDTLKYLESSISLIKRQDGIPIGFRGIVRDVTEQRHLEQQLRQALKMEAIGRLAGGIAHDFNSILTIIVGNIEEALSSRGNWQLLQENLNQIGIATKRASDLTRQIQTFCRNEETIQRAVRLSPIVDETIKLLRASIPKNIEIVLDINCPKDTVAADATQIHQILINLCTNASHAMMDMDNGHLQVRLTNQTLTESHQPPLPPGPYVVLQVQDTGIGIAVKNISRIFDPYFTTKEIGKGTGMGLAMVLNIVQAHRGDITVESVEGKGTTFTTYLPVSDNLLTAKKDDL